MEAPLRDQFLAAAAEAAVDTRVRGLEAGKEAIEALKQKGVEIIACDREPKRLVLLAENLARLGVQIAKTVRHDWGQAEIPQEILSQAPFDRILLDAPCTNTGVMRSTVTDPRSGGIGAWISTRRSGAALPSSVLS